MESSAQAPVVNCSNLTSRADFESYVKEIQQITNFDFTSLNSCKIPICDALWGSGNADIAGIGMVMGYVFEFLLGLMFALAYTFLLYERDSENEKSVPASPRKVLARKVLKEGCISFFNAAIFFAGSIEISCVVVLIRRDFGISAAGLGGLTTQITWSVALFCMLPLLWPMAILYHIDKENRHYRLFLFCACWLLLFYTFISQMIGVYGPDQIGAPDGVIDRPDWNKLTRLCLSEVHVLSKKENALLNGFGAAGSILIITYGVVYLLWFIAQRWWEEKALDFRKKVSPQTWRPHRERLMIMGLTVVVITLSIPQLWGILRLRGIQADLAKSTRSEYVDNEWTFGQVVAVMLFAPVITDIGHLLVQERGNSLGN